MQYTATSASSFIGSLGVNTHMSWANTPYDNVGQVESELSYLGISNIRDDVSNTTQEYNALSALMSQGVKVDMLANTDLSGFMTLANELETAHPGGVAAVEGLNEVDGGGVSYDGLTGYAAAIQFQQDLYTDVKADPSLSNVAVYNTTVAGVDDTQYLGNLSAYATDANDHIYYGGGEPAWGWSTGDSTYYWTSWLASGQVDAPGLPTVVTETGATTTGVTSDGIAGVDATTAAKQILNSLMDSAKNGVAMTYIYELADSSNNGPTDAQSNFGLFTWNGTAQPAAVAIHDLTSILGAGGPLAGTPGALNYTISGVPQWGGQMLFEQGNGTYDIVVWAEPTIWNGTSEVAAPNTPISVTLGTAANVSIYDPMVGTSPVESLGTTTQVDVNVVDHPIIIQVTPTSTTPTPAPASHDYYGDGLSQILIESTNGAVAMGEVGSSGQLSYTQVSSIGPEWMSAGSGDFLGEGHAQYLLENANGAIDVGSVSNGQATYTQVGAIGPEWTLSGTGTYLGESTSDFLLLNTNGAVDVGAVGSNDQATYTQVASIGSEWKIVASGDFLGEGHDQFLLQNTNGALDVGNVVNGQAQFTQVSAIGSAWTVEGAGDFLGNGQSQVLLENANGAVDIGSVGSNGQMTYTQVASIGSEWKFVGTGDVLGQGHDQFILENTNGAVDVGNVVNGQAQFTQVGALGSEWSFHM